MRSARSAGRYTLMPTFFEAISAPSVSFTVKSSPLCFISGPEKLSTGKCGVIPSVRYFSFPDPFIKNGSKYHEGPKLKAAAVQILNILTRTTGFLRTVSSHSAQPYRGCTLGRSLCGVGCYVQHNRYLTRGQPWGEFL